jgi:hypothetical protein
MGITFLYYKTRKFPSLNHNCPEALLTANNRTATISPGFTFLVKDSNIKIKLSF